MRSSSRLRSWWRRRPDPCNVLRYNNAGLTDTLSGKITLDTECNPLHGPRVQEIIEKLEAGEEVDKQAYVDEEMFAADDTVTSIKVDDADYEVTTITQDIIDGRAY